MSELTNVFARNMRDLTTPTSTGADSNTFNNAKIPIGNAPQGFEGTEALTVKQIKDLAADGRKEELDVVTLKITEEVTRAKEVEAALIKDKANKATTLSGYGIVNAYTQGQIDSKVNNLESKKANKVDVDTAFSNLSTTANKYYSTLAAATADIANIALNQSVTIGEAANSGLWEKKTAGAAVLTKSPYDPLTQSKAYTDVKIKDEFNAAFQIENPNLFTSAKIIKGKYVNSYSPINNSATAEMVCIAVVAGETYALYSPSYNSASFFAAYGDTDNPPIGPTLGLVAFSDSPTQSNVKIFTVPDGASYVYLNTLLPGMGFDIRSGVLINLGSEAKEESISKIKDANIIDLSAVKTTDLKITGPLYSASNNINNKFVRYNTGDIETSVSATVMNVFPVEAGETYTVYSPSYANGYFAIAFRNSAVSSNGPSMALATLEGSGDTRTFVVPEGATHAFMNVVVPSGTFDISTTVKVNRGTGIVSESSIAQISGSNLVDELARLEIEKIKNETFAPSPLKSKKWLVIGDSITHKNDRSRFNYHYYLAQDVGGMTVYNYGVSGTGFFNRHAVADTITQTGVDLITVFLGTNDWGNQTAANQKELGVFGDTGTTTISGCINTLLTGIINKFPLIPIAIFTPLPRATNYGLNAPDNSYGYNLKDLVDLLHEYATHYSLPILDLYSISNLYPWLPASNEHYFKPFEGSSYGTNPDGLHPNDAGHQLLARKMRLFLESI